VDGPGPYFGSIVGAEACGTKHCDLSRGIESDDATRTIVVRLTTADPELLHKLALPSASVVPSDTPAHWARRHPIPTIGPYRVASITPRAVRLVRNEHFRPWSTEARPDGYADEIRFRFHADSKAQLRAVKRGAGDWVEVRHVAPAEMKGLKTRFANRLHTNPASSQSNWFFLNTRVAPFDNLQARQAVNYAIDRERLIALNGEPAEPSCQILPPILPGYRPYCPYTRNPNRAGTWTAPDLTTARALVKTSGTTGKRVEVDMIGGHSSLGRYLASVLRELGYKSSLRVFPDPNAYYAYVGNPRNRAQIGWAGWIPDFLAASNFLRPLFTCAAEFNLFEYCSRALDETMMNAGRMQGSDTRAAADAWARVDRDLVDEAVALPWSTPRKQVLVSERVGNYQGHPLWGTLLDQLWVK
jgi:peptide/nickel transport system substrate-binding protein